MDPVCHTLAGAALGRAGLARRTSLGMTALIVGANLPDVDVLSHFAGPAADLAFRRGWTHGVLALAALPLLLTGALLLANAAFRGVRRAALPSAARPRELLLLSYVAVLSHPVLDSLNTYGVRWLMPFSGRWFYGDTLFIIDPWLWLALGLGIYVGRLRRAKTGFRVAPRRPARVALTLATAYIVAMAISERVAERIVLGETGGESAMVGPLPVTPFTREVVVTKGDRYLTGTFRWLRSPHLDPGSLREFPRGVPTDPAVLDALQTPAARRFLSWARFPTVDARDGQVTIIDLRYANAPSGFGSLTVSIP